jgi:hypothetical protein
VIAREQSHRSLSGGERKTNVVSALVETATRLVVQELSEGEQAVHSKRSATRSPSNQPPD